MMYDESNKILKNNSLTSSVYFLLLKKPSTITELSKIFYNGKIQLGHLNKIIKLLIKHNYIEEKPSLKKYNSLKNIDLRNKYLKATFKPIIDYSKIAIIDRNQKSILPREKLSENEITIYESILNSNWFNKFFEDNFLRTQHLEQYGEVYSLHNIILSACPIRFFAFMLEVLFSIRVSLQRIISPKIKEYDGKESFDNFIKKNKKNIDLELVKNLDTVKKRAKKYLGNYQNTNTAIDYYFREYAIIFIPLEFSKKLYSIGRVPTTVFSNFIRAVNSIKLKKSF